MHLGHLLPVVHEYSEVFKAQGLVGLFCLCSVFALRCEQKFLANFAISDNIKLHTELIDARCEKLPGELVVPCFHEIHTNHLGEIEAYPLFPIAVQEMLRQHWSMLLASAHR